MDGLSETTANMNIFTRSVTPSLYHSDVTFQCFKLVLLRMRCVAHAHFEIGENWTRLCAKGHDQLSCVFSGSVLQVKKSPLRFSTKQCVYVELKYHTYHIMDYGIFKDIKPCL